MGRSQWKFKFFSKNIWRKILKSYKFKRFKYRRRFIFERSSSIPSCFKGLFFRIYKGYSFRRLTVNNYNVGYKFGEFSFTRKPFHFPVKNKK